jgi:acyl transferase domain-containing protein
VAPPLRAALADGDRIYVIRAATVNQDGHLVHDRAERRREAAMLREAYEQAGVAPSVIYVEAHGTGTPWATPSKRRRSAVLVRDGPKNSDA